jgi:hypothetical protein
MRSEQINYNIVFVCGVLGPREEDARKMFVFGSQGANYSFPISITAPPNTQAKSNFPPPRGQLHREGRHAWFSTQNRSNSPRLPRRLRRRKSKRAAACAREFTTEKSIALVSLARIEMLRSFSLSLSRQRHAASRRRRRATLICRAREINFPCRLNESKTAWPMACLHSPARGQLINYTHFSPVQAPHDPKCHSPFTTLSRQKRQRAAKPFLVIIFCPVSLALYWSRLGSFLLRDYKFQPGIKSH